MSAHLSSLASTAVPSQAATSLWQTLVQRFPAVRNAAQYYLADAQKLTAHVVGSVHATYLAATSTDGGDAAAAGTPRSSDAALGSDTERPDTEAHYASLPIGELGVTLGAVTWAVAPCGTRVLLVCIEGGFAAFEVVPTLSGNGTVAVHELCVCLHHQYTKEFGAVTSVQCESRTSFVVLLSGAIGRYDAVEKKFVVFVKLSIDGKSVILGRRHAVVTSAEFNQLVVLDRATLIEQRCIFADRLVAACAPRWLAYSGTSDAAVGATLVHTQRSDTAMETVTRSVAVGVDVLKRGLGISPAMTGAAVPLGTVLVTDLDTGTDVAAFVAHDRPLQQLQWDSTGTMLATTSTEGLSVCVFLVDVGTDPADLGTSERGGSAHTARVTLMYRLTRGLTTGTITSLAFAPLGGWVAVCSSIGTCHLYRIPAGARSPPSATLSSHVAPAISALCRLRSAPSSAPVDPVVVFGDPSGGTHETLPLYLASATVTMVACEVSDAGVRTTSHGHLGTFNAPRTVRPVAGVSPPEAAPPADYLWRSHVELRTHPLHQKLRNFTVVVDGVSGDEG